MDLMRDHMRWSDCDELAASDPIACLMCRTSKLNDGFHEMIAELGSVKQRASVLGAVTAIASLSGLAVQLWRSVHGV